MKKRIFSVILGVVLGILAVQAWNYHEKCENLITYNQLEGDTLWKIEEGVYSDCKLGFYIYGPEGQKVFWDNTPDKYVINYETGEVSVNENYYK